MVAEDRISYLPLDLLTKILSRVNSRTAVRTSVLSRRWRYVWKSLRVANLAAHGVTPIARYRFIRSCTAFLLRLTWAANQTIHSFRLKIEDDILCGSEDLELWLGMAIRGGDVRNILLSVPTPTQLFLPRDVLSCNTLVSLKLTGIQIDLPDGLNIDLPSLKRLQVYGRVFRKPEHLERLAKGCPEIEDLDLRALIPWGDGSKARCVKRFDGCFSKLLEVRISSIAIPLDLFHNVNLMCLHFVKKSSVTFGNLNHLGMTLIHSKWEQLVDLLKSCPVLSSLHIQVSGNVVVGLEDTLIPNCIACSLKNCTVSNFAEADMEVVAFILKHATVLRRMTILCSSDFPEESNSDFCEKVAKLTRVSQVCNLIFK